MGKQRRTKFRFRHFYFLVFCLFLASNLFAQQLTAIRVASGLSSPLFVTAPPGDFNRLFIVQQGGQIRILNLTTGVMNATPFLTVGNIVTGGEQGLLGLAFDPAYASNGKFYVKCTAPGGTFNAGVNQIRQYQVSANPDVADTTPANIKTMLSIDQPETNHNGGWIGFSPRPGDDHNLYIATGDGGASNDQDGDVGHIEPGGNAQNKTTLLGKMLRIHVDPTTGTYTIPADNPYASPTPAPSPAPKREIWLLGLRNPFRDSFDRATGRMLIGDVGQDTREEVDVQQPTNPGGGENYGWRDREGFIQNPAYPTPTAAPTPTPNPPRVDPIFDYSHAIGRTIIGGYIYRGAQFPASQGVYIFGDYLGTSAAKVFTLNYDGTTASDFQDITSQLFPIPTTSGNVALANLSSLGEDAAGELYLTDITNGNVYKLSPMLVGAASRKVHSSTALDINLPLIGTSGIECRTGGANGNFTMVFRFAFPLSSVGGRTLTSGLGTVSSSTIGADPHEYIVNVSGVANAQYLTVTLTNATDVVGNTSSSVSATMGILLGDTTANGLVNSSDIAQTQSQSGQPVTANNCREDVTTDAAIDSSDIALVQSQSGTGLSTSQKESVSLRSKTDRRGSLSSQGKN
ncbi:MAG TPA: PQQ-dependent sugar dehydrogenase [Chthoniobacterales bacterium]|nr:PQQ-dependent sugar dehydrogenase [Chthoniobacterales bacterium]